MKCVGFFYYKINVCSQLLIKLYSKATSDIEDINDVADMDSISKPDYNELLQAFSAFKNDQQQFNRQ